MRPAPAPPADACPCGSNRPYAGCCGLYHADDGALPAPTAEALMRSRYSAYVRGLGGYLLATWHPDTRPARLDPDPPALRWLGLEVKAHRMTDGPAGDRATVEFVARSKLDGRAHRLHETSRFVREAGRWYYVDGDIAPPARPV
ncbi:MAG: SEC-C domain-containing protein [Ideonella sp.]|nr:SEC-C domain-containing protein [Ideonella sp.]